MRNAYDLTNARFGCLRVIKRAANIRGAVSWLCICNCGNEHVVRASNLLNGSTNSCGCLKKRIVAAKNNRYGATPKGRLYSIWRGMIYRCETPGVQSFKHYGGRGISVCPEWRNDYLTFRQWALSNGYSDTLSIDRIDFNGNYESSNCRWVDAWTQSNNKRTNKKYSFNGAKYTLAELAKMHSMSRGRLKDRIQKLGWKLEEALKR